MNLNAASSPFLSQTYSKKVRDRNLNVISEIGQSNSNLLKLNAVLLRKQDLANQRRGLPLILVASCIRLNSCRRKSFEETTLFFNEKTLISRAYLLKLRLSP